MPKDIELGVRLTADGKGFVGAITVSDKAVRRLRGATDKAAASTRGMAGSMRQAESAAKGAAGGFLAAHGRLAAYASGTLGIHQVARALLAVRDNSIRQGSIPVCGGTQQVGICSWLMLLCYDARRVRGGAARPCGAGAQRHGRSVNPIPRGGRVL